MKGRATGLAVLRDRGRVDLVVVGAGIYGAAAAYEAASRGLRVALLEKGDFGAGASANSLRIAHGGLRYLQKLDLRRARASARERSVLLQMASGLIRPMRFGVRTGGGLKRSAPFLASGLAFNSLLTFDRNRRLPPGMYIGTGGLMRSSELVRAAYPLLPGCDGLAAYWYDGFVEDPDRFLTEMVWRARDHGALVLNHVEAVEYLQLGGRIRGVAVQDALTGESCELASPVIVDCTSGWMSRSRLWGDAFRAAAGIEYLRAVNVVLDVPAPMYGVGAWSRLGRYLFAVPAAGRALAGTWYLPLRTDTDSARVHPEERARILEDLEEAFGGLSGGAPVTAFQLGVLPCEAIDANAADPQPLGCPRVLQGEVFGGPTGLWIMQGEKWTTARRLAEQVVDRIARHHRLAPTKSVSAESRLLDNAEMGDLPVRTAVPSKAVARLWLRRGELGAAILRRAAAENEAAALVPDRDDVIRGEVDHALAQEMTATLSDLLRRLGIGQLAGPSDRTLSYLAHVMGTQLGWTEDDRAREIEAVLKDPRWARPNRSSRHRPVIQGQPR